MRLVRPFYWACFLLLLRESAAVRRELLDLLHCARCRKRSDLISVRECRIEQGMDPAVAAIDAEIADIEALIEARPRTSRNNAPPDGGTSHEASEPTPGGCA